MNAMVKLTGLSLCALVSLAGACAGNGESTKPSPAAAKPSADEMASMMMEYSKPVAQHDIIRNFAGTWNADVKMWMDPNAEPTVSKGVMKGTMLHGDRYLLGEFSGTFENMPFSGTLLWAYNRVEGRYESTWSDSWGTGIMMSTGLPSADGKTINSSGAFRMPGPDGKLVEVTQRETITMVSRDKYTQQMWHTTKDQGEAKVMEITYTRIGNASKHTGATPVAPAGITMPPATH